MASYMRYENDEKTGELKAKDPQFRKWVKADGSSEYRPIKGRYHLFISLACAWAQWPYIVYQAKGLEDTISVSFVSWYMGKKRGWTFRKESKEGDDWEYYEDEEEKLKVPIKTLLQVDTSDKDFQVDTSNSFNNFKTLREFYLLSDPSYSGSFTCPMLWDKETNKVINNKPLEILRMLNSEFNEFAKNPHLDLSPAISVNQIDDANKIIEVLNDSIYSCGFAPSEEVYDRTFDRVFDTLDKLEEKLTNSKYLVGDAITESDVQLFTALVRFDPVFYGLFKINKKQLKDYPALYNYLRDLYSKKGFGQTTNLGHIKFHYYRSFPQLNPLGVVPKGPVHTYELRK